MVKRLPYPVYSGPWWVIMRPFCSLSPAQPGSWHLVHEYTYPDIWYIGYNITVCACLTQAQAHAAALDYAAHGQIITDLCPRTHGTWEWYFNGPLTPRWNIYHGQRGENLVPCIYWDITNPIPPPGYQYLEW